jgi:hypothetical protein
MSANNSQRRVS